MQLIKKYKKDEKITSFTIISGSDEPFRQTKDQRARIVRVALYIPNKLIKKSNSGKHEYLWLSSERLIEAILTTKEKDFISEHDDLKLIEENIPKTEDK